MLPSPRSYIAYGSSETGRGAPHCATRDSPAASSETPAGNTPAVQRVSKTVHRLSMDVPRGLRLSVRGRDIHRALYGVCTAWPCQSTRAPSWLVLHLLLTVAGGESVASKRILARFSQKPLAPSSSAIHSGVPRVDCNSYVSLTTQSRPYCNVRR